MAPKIFTNLRITNREEDVNVMMAIVAKFGRFVKRVMRWVLRILVGGASAILMPESENLPDCKNRTVLCSSDSQSIVFELDY